MENLLQYQQRLLLNNHETTLFYELKSSLKLCRSFQFNVAFITFGGIQLFAELFEELSKKGVEGKIITSTYLNFSDPKAIRKLKEFDNIEIKVHNDQTKGLHAKAYIFEFESNFKVIVGSSNLTEKALNSNIEWNVMTITKKGEPFYESIQAEYNYLWNQLGPIQESNLFDYEKLYHQLKQQRNQFKELQLPSQTVFDITPNKMQEDAIKNLNAIRKRNGKRALVVAATGTGKTYMSAFDVKQINPTRVLFIVHRENILDAAIQSFKDVLGKDIYVNKYLSTNKDKNADYIFSTNLTISNSLKDFSKDYFDYIIIDEAHHASASTYQNILNYFEPKFILGMTATPERMDEGNIFAIFDHNVGIEVRLGQAIDSDLVVPFHYFGITDIEDVDLSDVDIDDIAEVSKRLQVHKRTDYIIEKMKLFGHDGEKQKTLGFCVDIDHAHFMSNSFNNRGIESVAITGTMKPEQRQIFFDRLEDEVDNLKVIFAVDVLNEGIDIPSVNQVLMLRPTNSPVIFIQQLGRGLRIADDKKFLTVLDFIGNHNRTFLVSMALNGERYANKDSIKVQVDKDFPQAPKDVFIQMDEISKQRILEQLNKTNFNQLKYLRHDYFEFKAALNGIIPFELTNYLVHDGAPDPLKFARYEKNSYVSFLGRVEKDNSKVQNLIQDETLIKVTQSLHYFMPLVRPHEFLILRTLLSNYKVNISEVIQLIEETIEGNQRETTSHALKVLNFERFDATDFKRFTKLINLRLDTFERSLEFNQILENDQKYQIIEDLISYGLTRYFNQFGYEDYGYPFFKLYEGYSMREVGMLANIENKLSSFRGSGVLRYNNHYFLFVDLHKDADIKESIDYNDKLLSREKFQWESQNSTTQTSEVGQRFINHKDKNYHLHLFARKLSVIDGESLPYLYLGQVDVESYRHNKPIEFIFKLRHRVPHDVYEDLTYKVD